MDDLKQLAVLYGHSINAVIDDRIYISDETIAVNKDILCKFKITHIVNATNGATPNKFPESFEYIAVNVEDDGEDDILQYFDEVNDKLSSSNTENMRILFHCKLGISRSSSLLIAYLMRVRQMSLKDAFDAVKQSRAKICPNWCFAEGLVQYEKKVQALQHSSTEGDEPSRVLGPTMSVYGITGLKSKPQPRPVAPTTENVKRRKADNGCKIL